MSLDCRPRIAKECVCCGGDELSEQPAILMPFVAARVFGWEPVEINESWGLRDVACGMAYSVCRTLKCNHCGLVFLDIRFDDSEMSRLYTGYRGPEYVEQRTRFEPGYAVRNARFMEGAPNISDAEEFLTPHTGHVERVLDWGGDTGINTPFRREATTHHIYELSDTPLVPGAQRVEVTETACHEYDLVVLSHVLEHVPFPLDTLAVVRAAMREKTVLWVSVPFELALRTPGRFEEAYLAKRHWHEHVNFFTEDSLAHLLERAGLRVVAHRMTAVPGEQADDWHMEAVCRLAT
jgi:hypothetical protein